jgi:hypothetical protein
MSTKYIEQVKYYLKDLSNSCYFHLEKDPKDALLKIYPYSLELTQFERTENSRYLLIFESDEEFIQAVKKFKPNYQWMWKSPDGYEVTTIGDNRFSPFNMYVTYNDKLTNIETLHKTLKPQYADYNVYRSLMKSIYKQYLLDRKSLFYELLLIGSKYPFVDVFDKYGGQNKYYVEICNEFVQSLNDN